MSGFKQLIVILIKKTCHTLVDWLNESYIPLDTPKKIKNNHNTQVLDFQLTCLLEYVVVPQQSSSKLLPECMWRNVDITVRLTIETLLLLSKNGWLCHLRHAASIHQVAEVEIQNCFKTIGSRLIPSATKMSINIFINSN